MDKYNTNNTIQYYKYISYIYMMDLHSHYIHASMLYMYNIFLILLSSTQHVNLSLPFTRNSGDVRHVSAEHTQCVQGVYYSSNGTARVRVYQRSEREFIRMDVDSADDELIVLNDRRTLLESALDTLAY